MTKDEIYAEITADVLAAVDCAMRGEAHPRLNGMMNRTAARKAAFKPDCPIHLLPAHRVPFSKNNPAPLTGKFNVDAWYAGMTGKYGAQRND